VPQRGGIPDGSAALLYDLGQLQHAAVERDPGWVYLTIGIVLGSAQVLLPCGIVQLNAVVAFLP